MKHTLLILFACLLGATSIEAQDVWKKISNKKPFIDLKLDSKKVKPTKFELYKIDLKSLDNRLIKTKHRKSNNANKIIIKLPTPLGIQRFVVNEASVFSDDLATKYPNIKSYVGIGIDDPTAVARFSKSTVGFHAMISSGNYPLYLIDPYTKNKKVSIAYYKKNAVKSNFKCSVTENKKLYQKEYKYNSTTISDGKLRTYRLALITTGEYSQFHLNRQGISASATDLVKKKAVFSAINTSITRVNGIFERDLGITMKIVDNNTNLIFLDKSTDKLTDDDSELLLDESQIICDRIIGSTNYDIGHVFGTGGGYSDGLAEFGAVCINGEKAKGTSGLRMPINDPFDIDLVVHEIGHQFGANHTQNNSDCARNKSTAVEPGSGSTIMGYAGFCDPSVQNSSDAFFHAVSIAEIQTFINNSGRCAVETITNNAIPIAYAGDDFVIPKSTPFILKGSAKDADTENGLTYNWEQIDNQIAEEMPPLSTNTVGPAFRSLPPKTSSKRYMPSLSTVLAGKTSSKWEVVPSVARKLNFSLTIRDNVANGGATARDDMRITVDGNSGPFAVTSQTDTITLDGNSIQTITWNIANTSVSPVNCKNVNILLSTDSGLTYPITLISNTPNDGTQQVIIPNIMATQSRIMVEAGDNIFYAINNSIFSIDKTLPKYNLSFLNFKLHPNPSKGKITISFDAFSIEKITIKLFDIRGRLIDTQNYLGTPNHFSKEIYYKVASGLYILQIENGTKKIIRKVIIDNVRKQRK